MLFAVIALLGIFLLRYLPFRKKILIEGIFEKTILDHDIFSGEQFKSFIFRDFCKSCVEIWRKTGKRPLQSFLSPTCHGDIHCYSLDIGSLKPVAGDAVRLIVWRTVFGRARIYYFQKSDFVWTNWHDEEDRQEAEKGGFSSVEEYKIARKKEWHEKSRTEAMSEYGLTRDEAETLDFFGSMAVFAREAKRRGIIYLEVDEEYRDRIRNPDPDSVKFCENILVHPEDYTEQFIESGLVEQGLKEHLNECDICNNCFVKSAAETTKQNEEELRKNLGLLSPREAWLNGGAKRNGVTPEKYEKMYNDRVILWHGGEDCFTAKERITYAMMENLSDGRLAHKESCVGCANMIKADREEFLAGNKLTGVA